MSLTAGRKYLHDDILRQVTAEPRSLVEIRNRMPRYSASIANVLGGLRKLVESGEVVVTAGPDGNPRWRRASESDPKPTVLKAVLAFSAPDIEQTASGFRKGKCEACGKWAERIYVFKAGREHYRPNGQEHTPDQVRAILRHKVESQVQEAMAGPLYHKRCEPKEGV